MEINYNFMILEKLELIEVKDNAILGILSFRDDCYCKTYKYEICLRTLEERRKIARCCEIKKKCNIIIDILSRLVIEINSHDFYENIYNLILDPGGDPGGDLIDV